MCACNRSPSHSVSPTSPEVEPPAKQPRLSNQMSSGKPTDHDKYQLIVSHFTPDRTYKFPKTDGRIFQHNWLNTYPWLRYSEVHNGGYCLPCVLFSSSPNDLRAEPGMLVKTPLTSFRKALELCNKHADKLYHKTAVTKLEAFRKVMTSQQPSIREQLNKAAAQMVATNRKKLRSITETIILCGRQNIPLRSHRDSGMDVECDTNVSRGNFWALLQFRVAAGDITLGEHLAKAPRNAIYTSPDVQNQVINILGDHIRGKILSKVREAQFFTLVADEVTDSSNMEQLSIVLRYVDPNDCCIKEDLVTFIECDSGISG